jgi:ABC-type sugar transport system permease subunit
MHAVIFCRLAQGKGIMIVFHDRPVMIQRMVDENGMKCKNQQSINRFALLSVKWLFRSFFIVILCLVAFYALLVAPVLRKKYTHRFLMRHFVFLQKFIVGFVAHHCIWKAIQGIADGSSR